MASFTAHRACLSHGSVGGQARAHSGHPTQDKPPLGHTMKRRPSRAPSAGAGDPTKAQPPHSPAVF